MHCKHHIPNTWESIYLALTSSICLETEHVALWKLIFEKINDFISTLSSGGILGIQMQLNIRKNQYYSLLNMHYSQMAGLS